MSHTSLGLLACGLILAFPGGPAPRQTHRLAWTGPSAHATDCRRQHGAHRGACLAAAGSDEIPPDVSVMDDLDSCSPFWAIDGDKELDFDTASGAVTEVDNPSGELRGPASSRGVRTIGTFVTSDATGRVSLVIGGVRRDYTLVIPADGEQCILALGKPNAVDLEKSWFGEITDDPEADGPEYQRASASHVRPSPAGRPSRHGISPSGPAAIAARFVPA